jgi:hypothetical protein
VALLFLVKCFTRNSADSGTSCGCKVFYSAESEHRDGTILPQLGGLVLMVARLSQRWLGLFFEKNDAARIHSSPST